MSSSEISCRMNNSAHTTHSKRADRKECSTFFSLELKRRTWGNMKMKKYQVTTDDDVGAANEREDAINNEKERQKATQAKKWVGRLHSASFFRSFSVYIFLALVENISIIIIVNIRINVKIPIKLARSYSFYYQFRACLFPFFSLQPGICVFSVAIFHFKFNSDSKFFFLFCWGYA